MALRPQRVAPELLTKVTKALGITVLDQWHYVSHHAATKSIGLTTLNQFGGTLSSFLKCAYPQHKFDEEKLAPRIHHEKDQKFMEVLIRELFPNTEIHTKARKAVGIINPETEAYLEIDIWIPSLKLGIEYQDKHHYGYQWYAYDTLENYQKRDAIKKSSMSGLGYTLITVGYWWDKSIESLAATIRKYRPDLLKEYEHENVTPITSDPPLGQLAATPVIPGVSGIMNPFIPKSDFNPTNWYGGEKHDGIRGMYNPNMNKMFSRSGNELSVHSSLLKDVPNMLVEGEVIAGRRNYSKTVVVSHHTHHDKVNWPVFRYVIFDIPDSHNQLGSYTMRYSTIMSGLQAHPFIFTQLAFRVLLTSKDHLKMLLDAIIVDDGEGVIAQQDTLYEYGRGKTLAKIKVRRDADAQVLHINELYCTCKLVSGITADIHFSHDFDPSNLKVGDIVSYYLNGYAQSGMPKRPEIYKVRYDITWEELTGEYNLKNSDKQRIAKDAIGGSSLNTNNTGKKKKGHWRKASNVRAYFDEFAQINGFDPLVPENWYPVMVSSLQTTGGSGMLYAFHFNVQKALSIAYPELKFEAEKFVIRTKVKNGHWDEPPNVRAFFDEFARTAGYDPLVADNWSTIRPSTIQKAKGSGLITAHKFDIQKALSVAYPELKFGGSA